MSTRAHALYRRHRRNLWQFVRFGLVGGSGVVVNQAALVAVNKAARGWFGLHRNDPFLPLLIANLHVRWYHVFIAAAFMVANLWNYQLNRSWTFKSSRHAPWWKEYWPFLATGLVGLAVGLVISTALLHEGSPVSLPSSVFDDSSGLRNKLYWANLIQILLVMPINYLVNKLWTFRAIRTRHPVPMVAPVVDPDDVDESGTVLPDVRASAGEDAPRTAD